MFGTTLMAGALCCLFTGCLSQEAIQRIEGTPGQEGTGVFMSRLPEVIRILATYEASDRQRATATERAQSVLARIKQDLKEGEELPSHIAVETEADNRLHGKAAVMLWDTQAEQIVGNKVYDIKEAPPSGASARWESYTATFYASDVAGGG